MEYHVVIDGRQQGPLSTPQLREWLREGKISPDSRVWRRGMADWKPLREVDALETMVSDLEDERGEAGSPGEGSATAGAEADESDAGGATPDVETERQLSPGQLDNPRSGPSDDLPRTDAARGSSGTVFEMTREARAGLRFLARIVDLFLISMLVGAYILFTKDEPMEWLQDPENRPSVTLLLPVVAILYESLLVAVFGSTPGKLFFGMRLEDPEGQPISPKQAFIRALGVWAAGFGFGIFILPVVLPLYWWFTFRRTGRVPWDGWSGLRVAHQRPGRVQLAIGLIIVVLVFWQVIASTAALAVGSGG